jgi:PIN domain nuclease of toxin-antitoxin system
MKLLLDAHTFLWFVWDEVQLTNDAKALIVNPTNQKLISTATYWEIAIKVSIGKLDLDVCFVNPVPVHCGSDRG